jgi:hypothetical protein
MFPANSGLPMQTPPDTGPLPRWLPPPLPAEAEIIVKGEKSLEDMLRYCADCDVILVEGFKKERIFRKIVCLREKGKKKELFDGLELFTASLKEGIADYLISNDAHVGKMAAVASKKPLKLIDSIRGENKGFHGDRKDLPADQGFIDIDPVPVIQGQLIEGQQVRVEAGFPPNDVSYAASDVLFKNENNGHAFGDGVGEGCFHGLRKQLQCGIIHANRVLEVQGDNFLPFDQIMPLKSCVHP